MRGRRVGWGSLKALFFLLGLFCFCKKLLWLAHHRKILGDVNNILTRPYSCDHQSEQYRTKLHWVRCPYEWIEMKTRAVCTSCKPDPLRLIPESMKEDRWHRSWQMCWNQNPPFGVGPLQSTCKTRPSCRYNVMHHLLALPGKERLWSGLVFIGPTFWGMFTGITMNCMFVFWEVHS